MRRLEAAGYANVGKTNLHEFAYGISSQNPHFGTVPNPAAPGRLAGGSSGGNGAALAAATRRGHARHRLRRVDPHPRRVVRDRRVQADLGARAARRLLPARAELRHRGADGAHRRGVRRRDARARAGVRDHDARARGSPRRRRVDRARRPARARPRRGGRGALREPYEARAPSAGGHVRRDVPRVHARGRRRSPRAVRRARGFVRRQRPPEDRGVPRGHGRRRRARAQAARRAARAVPRGDATASTSS